MNIEISYGDHEPDLLSQSLTGRASTSLGPWRGLAGQALNPPCDAMQRRCAEPGPGSVSIRLDPGAVPSQAARAGTGRSNRENRGASNPMQRRCADRPASPCDRKATIMLPPKGGSRASANRRSFLENGERTIRLELGCEGNSTPNQAVGTRTGFSLRR
jgi:hypothetical protein